MSTDISRQLGYFTFPTQYAMEYPSEALRVMGKCVILRAEHRLDMDCIEYWAVSDHFRFVPLWQRCPEYIWHCTSEGDFWCEEVKQ